MTKIRIAWVEDSLEQIDKGKEYLLKYSKEKNYDINATFYNSAEDFLLHYDFSFDIVLMDIELPLLDGMKASAKLRQIDKEVVLMFITNVSKMAAKGYEVDALDYILKSLSYPHFEMKMNRAIEKCLETSGKKIQINTKDGLIIVSVNKLKYIEVINHQLLYNFTNQVIEVRGTLKQSEKMMSQYGFLKCNACYLVNPKFIQLIDKYDIDLGNDKILISHPKKKKFMDEFMEYMMNKR